MAVPIGPSFTETVVSAIYVQALLDGARQDELALLEHARAAGAGGRDPVAVASELWNWLAAEEHRALLNLWVEGYARSLIDPDGPWGGSRRPRCRTGSTCSGRSRRTPASALILAVLRGALLDLLATGELERVSGAVNLQLALMRAAGDPPAGPGRADSTRRECRRSRFHAAERQRYRGRNASGVSTRKPTS
jgi:hypothetical protein